MIECQQPVTGVKCRNTNNNNLSRVAVFQVSVFTTHKELSEPRVPLCMPLKGGCFAVMILWSLTHHRAVVVTTPKVNQEVIHCRDCHSVLGVPHQLNRLYKNGIHDSQETLKKKVGISLSTDTYS